MRDYNLRGKIIIIFQLFYDFSIIILQDCIAMANMRQTAGLVIRKNIVADRDAEAIKLMRSAGAIPLALTNVSELAMWWESSNCLFGTTKNPYNTRYDI